MLNKRKKTFEVPSPPEEYFSSTPGWSADILKLYEVQGLLGVGGMGKVHLLRNRATGMRFAVKRAIDMNSDARQDFLAELQTWIDLPEHPNLVPCRSFTLGEEVLIFADYVEGGSLEKWIKSKQLYSGGEKAALGRVLDTAIQFAWGLHCLHELGIVHRDVKPANVMVTQELSKSVHNIRVSVADYGVARVGLGASSSRMVVSGGKNLTSCGRFTSEYASPEQIAGGVLDWRTDLWSWGVSVLEMFYGKLPFGMGGEYLERLKELVNSKTEGNGLPLIPAELSTILHGCFQEYPADRWKSMPIVIDRLKRIYRAGMDAEYLRELPQIGAAITPCVGIGERLTREGRSWRNPRTVLLWALQEAGRSNEALGAVKMRRWSSRHGQLVADIAVYDEARVIIDELIRGGRKDLEKDLAYLQTETALVLETADDYSGALELYDKAIEIYERLVDTEGRSEFANELAKAYRAKGLVLHILGFSQAAVLFCDKAVQIHERLVNAENPFKSLRELSYRLINAEGRSEYVGDLAQSLRYKGIAVYSTDVPAAISLLDEAETIYYRLVHNNHPRNEFVGDLSTNRNDCTAALFKRGYTSDSLDAISVITQSKSAIHDIETRCNTKDRARFAPILAKAYENKAIGIRTYNSQGKKWSNKAGFEENALDFNTKAIEIYERLVFAEGRSEFFNDLAIAYQDKANTQYVLGEPGLAMNLCDKAIAIYERLVFVEGRSKFAHDLVSVYSAKAKRFSAFKKNESALVFFDKAIKILERLTAIEAKKELVVELSELRVLRRQSFYARPGFNNI